MWPHQMYAQLYYSRVCGAFWLQMIRTVRMGCLAKLLVCYSACVVYICFCAARAECAYSLMVVEICAAGDSTNSHISLARFSSAHWLLCCGS